jgi:predicted outer membrane repeat protein
MNSSAGRCGGAIILFDSNLQLRAWNDSHLSLITIQGNSAMVNGGFMSSYYLTITIGQYHFKNNSAKHVGVFIIRNTSLTLVGSSDLTLLIVFEDNIATNSGGAVEWYTERMNTTSKDTFMFCNNMSYSQGGAIYASRCMIKMRNCLYISNKANSWGEAMAMYESTVTLNNSDNKNFPVEFHNNGSQMVCHSFSFVALGH